MFKPASPSTSLGGPTSAKTVDEYISKIAEPRRNDIKKLHEFIKKTVPKLKPHILAGMIGYGTFHYKYTTGREGEWSIVALASQKNYISVYICATKDGKYVPELYKEKFGKASIGRSCIRFKKFEDMNLEVLKKAILDGVNATPKL